VFVDILCDFWPFAISLPFYLCLHDMFWFGSQSCDGKQNVVIHAVNIAQAIKARLTRAQLSLDKADRTLPVAI